MDFQWHLPTNIVFGVGRLASTHQFVRGLGKKAFIVTSRSFENGPLTGILDSLKSSLARIQVEHLVYGKIKPNPRTTSIDEGARIAREFRPRYIIALGGGSVMDAAKCIAMLAVNEGKIYDYAYTGAKKTLEKKPRLRFNHALPVVCIPTIAATSSETDPYAVVTNWEENKKVTVFGQALQPTLSIIDPELTYSVGHQQSVDGAFDIITHAMESYLSSPKPTPIQDRITEAIVETVVSSLPKVLENPKDELNRSQLSWCAALALSGVLSGRSGAWPIHALEHGLSAYTDLSHGRGLSLLLPRVMAFDQKIRNEKIASFNKKLFYTENQEHGLNAYMKKVGAWTSLKSLFPEENHQSLIAKTIEHAMETSGVWKKDQPPFLDNIIPIYEPEAKLILQTCVDL